MLAIAVCKENDFDVLSYLLSAIMNFSPTAPNLISISNASVPARLPEFLSCQHAGKRRARACCGAREFVVTLASGLSHNAVRMLGWIRAAEGKQIGVEQKSVPRSAEREDADGG